MEPITKLALKSSSSSLSLWSAEVMSVCSYIWCLFNALTGDMALRDIVDYLNECSSFAVIVNAPVGT